MDGVDLCALECWMDACQLGEGPLLDPTPLTGGTQNILLRFSRGDQNYVFRRPPIRPRSNSNDAMRREMRVLEALAESDVPHPRFIAGSKGDDVMGVAFYLMAPVDGFNPAVGLPQLHAESASIRHRIGLAMVEGLAALGSVDYRAVGLKDFGKPETFLDRQVGRWHAQLESYGELDGWPGTGSIPGVEAVAKWLDRHRPDSFQPGIIHGDAHLANVMIRNDSGELAAFVDWELSTIGDPLLDLASLLTTWPADESSFAAESKICPLEGFARPDELAGHYAAVSGRELFALDWYRVLACYKLGIILEGTYARSCAGLASRETGNSLHADTIDLFERALRIIRRSSDFASI